MGSWILNAPSVPKEKEKNALIPTTPPRVKCSADWGVLVFLVYHHALHPVSPWLPCCLLEEQRDHPSI